MNNLRILINENTNIFVTFIWIIIVMLLLLIISLITCICIVVFKNKKKKKKIFSHKENLNLSTEQDYSKSKNDVNSLKYQLKKEIEDLKLLNEKLKINKQEYFDIFSKLNNELNLQNDKLLEISKLSIDEAKNELFANLYKQMYSDLNRNYEKEKKFFDEKLNEYAQECLVVAMEGMAEKIVTQRSLTTIELTDENLKGKIIGKNGRNKHVFEMLTGVDMIVGKKSEIIISTVNPIRKEIATNLLEEMIKAKIIEPGKIENLFEVVKNEFDNNVIEYGKDILHNTLQIFDIDPKIYKYVGRLRFRSSYGQNVLQHCIEAAKFAENIAIQIGIDPEKAKRAAFFHDIGKSIDFDENYDHVESGLIIGEKCYFPEYIMNAIESHHNKIEPNNIYAALVKVVDTLSAARPGARPSNSLNDFIKRINRLEEICKNINGVKDVYALQSGRTLRVIVQPDVITDENLTLLSYEIQKAIETDELTNKYQIKVIIIREKRLEFLVNKKIDNSLLDVNEKILTF